MPVNTLGFSKTEVVDPAAIPVNADPSPAKEVAVQTPVNLRANPTLVSFSSALRGSVLATSSGAAFSAMVAPRVTLTVSNTGTANSLVAGFGGSASVHLDAEL